MDGCREVGEKRGFIGAQTIALPKIILFHYLKISQKIAKDCFKDYLQNLDGLFVTMQKSICFWTN